MDDIQLKEVLFYLESYGNHMLMVSFYQRHGYLQKALQYILENVRLRLNLKIEYNFKYYF